MGHSTAVIKLDRTELSANPSTIEIMEEATYKWRHNPDEDSGDPRPTYPQLSTIASESAAYNLLEGADWSSESKIIPLTNDYIEKTSTVRLEVTAAELRELRRGRYYELFDQGRFSKDAVKVEIAQLPKARAPRATATEGKAVTLYRIVNGKGHFIRGVFESSYASQADARSAAVDYMKEHPECSELAVEAFVQRDTGSAALVTITRPEPETATATFKVTTQTPKPNAKITGYLVSFDYHH